MFIARLKSVEGPFLLLLFVIAFGFWLCCATASQTDGEKMPTRMDDMVECFRIVLEDAPGEDDFETTHLFRALWVYEKHIRDYGQSKIADDVRQNILKIQSFYEKVPTECLRESMASLLECEKAMGCHQHPGDNGESQPLPRLRDPSAAVGWLWICRNLAFQSKLYSLVLDSNMDTLKAAQTAYRSELRPYHGWALRKFYSLGLRLVTPSKKKMLASIGGFSDHRDFDEEAELATEKGLRHLLSIWQPILLRSKILFSKLGLEDESQA